MTTRSTTAAVTKTVLVLAAMLTATGAQAQATGAPGGEPAGPNTGRLVFAANLDIASSYVFRGILQDDQGMIAWPAADVGLTLTEGNGAVKNVAVHVGTWNSLHSGPTGSDGPSGKLWYESDFYASVSVGLGRGIDIGTTYTAYTSPNSTFRTVREIAVRVAVDDRRTLGRFAVSPYALVAFEVDGQADGGDHRGQYLELGIAPELPIATNRLTLACPIKLGLSLKDYYEGPAREDTFGYLDTGLVATVPLGFIPGRFGSWNVRGGVSVLTLGANPRIVNHGDRTRVVALFGAGLSY
jgi:hypothetical protein